VRLTSCQPKPDLPNHTYMAVIDTLKLARALRDKGGFTEDAAEATAEAINDALGPQMASKADLDQAMERLRSDIRLLSWQIAVTWGLQVITIIPGAWLLLKMAAKIGVL